MTLAALSPDNGWEFLTAITQAWNWTQERPRFYADSGSNQTFFEYLEEAKSPNKKQLAVMNGGQMVSLITVRLVTDGEFEIHVTSPRKTSAAIVLAALQCVRDGLFADLGAKVIRCSVATYGIHEHKGNRRLAEACGMTATDVEWVSVNDSSVKWREYEIRK